MDSALIELARAGDRVALERLLQEIAPLVRRYGLRMCRHEADADDVLQDTLLSVTKNLPDFRGGASLSSWLFTLARTACARKRRGLKNQPFVSDEAIAEPSSHDATPERAADENELRRALEGALARLSDEHREVLILRDVEGMTAPEVADDLGLSVQAVKSRLHRARAALREALHDVLERHAPPPGPGCPDVLAAFSHKLEGDLAAADCAAMEQHVSACPSCASACSALRQALWACRTEAAQEVPEEVQTRVKEALRALAEGSARLSADSRD